MKHLILATAGHVDHGKTSLVRALTGTDTDRLPEEKARGITIDLGFAHLSIPGYSIGIIDVPGHEDFVQNMIAGIGSIDLALLVVAADDGWMPQTEEHLQILQYLRVARAVIALTKSDLGEVEQRQLEIRDRLRGTAFADAPIVETSMRKGGGVELLKETLARQFAELPAPRDLGKARLFVDRVFTLRGTGTVVTGTLSGGRLTSGETVAIQPQGLRARIRAVQSHNQTLNAAEPAMRTALNLPEVSVDDIRRGAVITTVDASASAISIDVLLERSERLPPTTSPLRNGELLHVHYGSGRLIARVTLLGVAELLTGQQAIARLRFETPVWMFVGDRLIVRDSSEQRTIAGGCVLDADADGRKFRSTSQRTFLKARAENPGHCRVLVSTLLRRDHFTTRALLVRKSRFSTQEIAAACAELESLYAIGEMIVDAEWWQQNRQRACAAVDAEHKAHPDHPGLEINQLRRAMPFDSPALFDALLLELCKDGFERSRTAIKRTTHRPSLPPPLRAAGDRIRAQLSTRPLDPPSRKELAPDENAQQALRFLCETGEVISLNEEVAVSSSAFAQMRVVIAKVLRAQPSATLSELRQAVGSTRRILVPLLERLDRDGVTIRRGDVRSLSRNFNHGGTEVTERIGS